MDSSSDKSMVTLSGEIVTHPSTASEESLNIHLKGRRSGRGRPKRPLAPLDMVEVTSDGEVIPQKAKQGRPTKYRAALKKITPDIVYDLARLYYRIPDIPTLCDITKHKKEFLIELMKTTIWQEQLLVVRKEFDKREESKTTSIVHQALDLIEDNLKHGDDVLDSKTGTVVKVKIKAKDAANIIKQVQDLRKDVRGEKSTDSVAMHTMDRLKYLADQFERQVNAKVINQEDVK